MKSNAETEYDCGDTTRPVRVVRRQTSMVSWLRCRQAGKGDATVQGFFDHTTVTIMPSGAPP